MRRADHHQQHGRRPARVDAQHPRNGRSLPPLWRPPAARLGPLRRERLFHQDPRGGLCRQDHQGDRPRNLHLCRHHDHLGQEGRCGEHGRIRGHAQRRALQAGHDLQHHVRGLRDLRRHVGPRHGCAGRGTRRKYRIRTTRRPHPPGETAGRPARRIRRTLPAAGRRTRHLRRCEKSAPQPAEGTVYRPDARRGALFGGGNPRRGDRLDPRRPRPRYAREPLPAAGTAAPGDPAAACRNIYERRAEITTGYRITFEAPILRHFTVELDKI